MKMVELPPLFRTLDWTVGRSWTYSRPTAARMWCLAESPPGRCGIYRQRIYVAGSPAEMFPYRSCSKAFVAGSWRGHRPRLEDKKGTAVARNMTDGSPGVDRRRRVD